MPILQRSVPVPLRPKPSPPRHGAWTPTPTTWDNMYLETLFAHEWEVVESPAGAKQWQPREVKEGFMVPDAHIDGKMNPPTMSTADMAMITDPAYLEISKRFYENPDEFNDAFARAWYKLTHRDMGPYSRLLGPEVPAPQLWQDPVPAVDHELALLRISDDDGNVMALVANYACHNTTLRGQFMEVHGDWAGCAQAYIEAEHPGTACLITIGCGADSDPCPHSTVELCERHGRSMADEVKRLLAGPFRPVDFRLSAKAVFFFD